MNLDRAAVPLDRCPHLPVIRQHDVAQRLSIDSLAECCGPGDVAKQKGNELPSAVRGRPSVKRFTARATKARGLAGLRSTCRAGQHRLSTHGSCGGGRPELSSPVGHIPQAGKALVTSDFGPAAAAPSEAAGVSPLEEHRVVSFEGSAKQRKGYGVCVISPGAWLALLSEKHPGVRWVAVSEWQAHDPEDRESEMSATGTDVAGAA